MSKFDRAKALQTEVKVKSPTTPMQKEKIICIIQIDYDSSIHPEKNEYESKDRLGFFIQGKSTYQIKQIFQQNYVEFPNVSQGKILYADGAYLKEVDTESDFFPM